MTERATMLTHEFVTAIPDELCEGVIYVSIPFATAVHKCCSGCGREVVTPLSPTDWQITFDGESISLTPSVGNWSFECQSHYWVTRNRVKWARRWFEEDIALGRASDRLAKQERFAGGLRPQSVKPSEVKTRRPGFSVTFLNWLRSRWK